MDAHTGRPYKHGTEHYWKTLDAMAQEYISHPESKFRNGNAKGKLRRMTLQVTDCLKHIGKEANEIEESDLGLSRDRYVEYAVEPN